MLRLGGILLWPVFSVHFFWRLQMLPPCEVSESCALPGVPLNGIGFRFPSCWICSCCVPRLIGQTGVACFSVQMCFIQTLVHLTCDRHCKGDEVLLSKRAFPYFAAFLSGFEGNHISFARGSQCLTHQIAFSGFSSKQISGEKAH